MDKLILASASPQRKQLMNELGLVFDVFPSSVDEAGCTETDPARRAVLLARLKARDVKAAHPQAFVIGCDTLVMAADGTLLEKPDDASQARRMLMLHSGGISTVYSGLCVIAPGGEEYEAISESRTEFKKLTDSEIDWWIGTGLWRGRSGGFQIDGPGQLMISRIEGDYTGIVGLPVFLLGQLLEQAGYPLKTSALRT